MRARFPVLRAQRPRGRRGFSLLEVMIAVGILVVSLAILLETMTSAAVATREAEHIITATQLAQEKMTEVHIWVEKEGIKEQEIHETGDFSDFGDERMNLEFGEELEAYHYEWWVSEIDIGLAGDIASMAGDMDDAGLLPEQTDDDAPPIEDQAPSLDSLGIGNDMITEMLGRYIREVRVRVWWGDDSGEAEELRNEVIVTTHITDPSGSFRSLTGEDAAAGGGAGGGTGGGTP